MTKDLDLSILLVLGGSGDYFEVADTVLGLKAYEVREITARAHAIATEQPRHAGPAPTPMVARRARMLVPNSIQASKGRHQVHLRARDTDTLVFGTQEIDARALLQVVDSGQLNASGELMLHVKALCAKEECSLKDAFLWLEEERETRGLDWLSRGRGDLVMPRVVEVAGLLNRLRSLKVD